MIKNYGYILLTIILSLILIIPFVLKLRNPGLEIYPGIIFPSGAGTFKKTTEIVTIPTFEVYGCKNGIKQVKFSQFFKNVPGQYFSTLRSGNFGLEKFEGVRKIYTPEISFKVENDFNQSNLKKAQYWFKERLREQNMQDSIFILREYKIDYNINTKNVVSKKLVDERIFDLNE